MIQFKGFKPQAMQRIAGTLGYQGDMAGFNDYLNQNPDKKQQMGMYQQKAMQMLQGGMVKMQQGGMVPQQAQMPLTQLFGQQPQQAQNPYLVQDAEARRKLEQEAKGIVSSPVAIRGGLSPEEAIARRKSQEEGLKAMGINLGDLYAQQPQIGQMPMPLQQQDTAKPVYNYTYREARSKNMAQYGKSPAEQAAIDAALAKGPEQDLAYKTPQSFVGMSLDAPLSDSMKDFIAQGKRIDGRKMSNQELDNLEYFVGTDRGGGQFLNAEDKNGVPVILTTEQKQYLGSKNNIKEDQFFPSPTSSTFNTAVDPREQLPTASGTYVDPTAGLEAQIGPQQQQQPQNVAVSASQELYNDTPRAQTAQLSASVPPQTPAYTGESITQLQAQRAMDPSLAYGATVEPVGTQVTQDQLVDPSSGQLVGDIVTPVSGASTTQAYTPEASAAATYAAGKTAGQVGAIADQTTAATGAIREGSTITEQQGTLSEGAIPDANTMNPDYVDTIVSGERTVSSDEIAVAQGLNEDAVKANIAETNVPDNIKAAQTTVQPNEIPNPALIAESDMSQAVAITMDGLTKDATATAAILNSFNVDNGTLAEFKAGKIEAQDTVQGQLSNLMKQFDDGTPVWAAGAMRAANAAMASRGLGGSSMAAQAIVQAAMESSLPIAAQDAQAFREMNMSNLNRQQQIALSNAAAQQGVKLANFNAQQQVALQNSQNAFSLQSQNLSNLQQVVITNAQLKAALQGQNLNNQQQANMAEAARYAEVNNVNLNNSQQGILQDNANTMQVNIANLNAKQQSYIANAQLAASLQGQKISNQQQVAITNAARFADAANITFNAKQQEQLHNSELMKTIGLAELSAAQAATLQGATTIASMDMANLNNRQQSAVLNAQNFLQMDLTNLSNEQQTELFRSQQKIQSLFTDQAAENASKQFNATSENQVDQFFASLQSQVAQFNAAQANAQNQFNAGESNVMNRFASEMMNQRDQFNAQNRLVIDQNNAQWRRQVATADTAAINRANEINAQNVLDISNNAYNDLWSYYQDSMEWAWNSAENERKRIMDLASVKLQIDAKADIASMQADYQSSAGWGGLMATMFTTPLGGDTLLGKGLGALGINI